MSIEKVTPTSQLPYQNDWTAFLQPGDSIASRAWTIDPPATLAGSTSEVVLASGFERGRDYNLQEAIVTANNIKESRGFMLRCELDL